MLAASLQLHHSLIADLAKTWLDSGATSFEIWARGDRIACWAQSQSVGGSYLSAAIQVAGKEVGQIRVMAPQLDAFANRLQMDANLLSAMATCESNTSDMAAELIATRDQLLALYNLTRSANTSIELDQAIGYLVQDTVQLTQSQSSFVVLQLEDSPAQFIFHPRLLVEKTRLLWHIEKMKSRKADYWFVPRASSGLGTVRNNLLLMPFQVRGADTAVIGIHTDIEQASLSPLIKLLRTIADYTGVRVENLLMIRESMELARLNAEMALAKTIQESLHPKRIPIVAGLDIWAISQPASVVGGDFYDLIEKPDQPLTFTVGDISGKGIPAAIPMATARAIIHYHTQAFSHPKPHAILASLNDEFYKDFTDLGMFATAFVGQYDPSDSSIQYANAGHSPVIYRPDQGHAQLLQANDIPLGLLTSATYGDRQLYLHPADILMIGTDSFYETHNLADEIFGLDRLLQQVDRLSGQTAQEIGEGLLEAIEDFRGIKAQDDDQTLIIIKRTNYR